MDVTDMASLFAVTQNQNPISCYSELCSLLDPVIRGYTRRVQENGVTHRPVYLAACYFRLSATGSR